MEIAGGTDPSRIMFIGDRVDLDVLPPMKLGMQVVYYDRRREHTVVPAGVRTIRHWDEWR